MNVFKRQVWLLGFLAGCVVELEPDDGSGPALGSASSELAADPAGVSAYVACEDDITSGNIDGHVFWPRNGSCASSVYSPLVVIIKGNGYSHTDFDYLAEHLARNGYIAATLEVSVDSQNALEYQEAADEAWDFMSGYLWTEWDLRLFIDPTRVGLVGHSRGGEAVRYLAETIKDDVQFHVRSVVQLAPTEDTDLRLDGDNTQSALVIVGAADADTLAERAYRVHDRAGSDFSQRDPLINPNGIWRSMKMLPTATHDAFAVDAGDEPSPQAETTQGYVLAYFHAHLKNDLTYYEDYIRGDEMPGPFASVAATQYLDGFYRRVVDNFDDGLLSTPTMLGAGMGISFGAGASVVNLATSNASPHYTHVLRYVPPASGAGVSWSIPANSLRDVSGFKYLSLRVGQIAGAATDDLRIRINNGGVLSPSVRVTDHGTLVQARTMCTSTDCATIVSQNHLGTIRIPLSAFGDHDDVRSISLSATSEATDGEFYLDNLEFSEWIFMP
jgi:dienelactone hydrolase